MLSTFIKLPFVIFILSILYFLLLLLIFSICIFFMVAQWLSVRVLDLRLRGCGFEPQERHCVVVLEQDTFILA